MTAARQAQIEREGFKAVAVAPLIAKERVHGALVVHYWTERTVSDQELAALRLLGEQAAVAIDNAQNYAAATRRAERMRELAEVERLVAGSLELDDVLRRIAEATARLLGAPVVHLWTADPDRRQLRLRAWSVEPGMPDVVMPKVLDFGEGITGTAAERRAPIFVHDASQDPRVANRNWWREAGLGTILAVPMTSGDTLLGVLTVRARPGNISPEEDTPLVNSLAGQATLAIRNAHAYADAVRRGARLRELAALSQSITASLDTPDVMQRIVDAAAGMAPDALAAVHIFDAARNVLRFVAFSSLEMSELPHERPAEAGLPGLVFERRQPVLVENPHSHPRALAPNWWQARPRATYFGAPIMVGEVLLGVLDYVTTEGPPDSEAQEALRLLTAYAGIAIRNASLYQAERSQAARVAALAGINQRISSALEPRRPAPDHRRNRRRPHRRQVRRVLAGRRGAPDPDLQERLGAGHRRGFPPAGRGLRRRQRRVDRPSSRSGAHRRHLRRRAHLPARLVEALGRDGLRRLSGAGRRRAPGGADAVPLRAHPLHRAEPRRRGHVHRPGQRGHSERAPLQRGPAPARGRRGSGPSGP